MKLINNRNMLLTDKEWKEAVIEPLAKAMVSGFYEVWDKERIVYITNCYENAFQFWLKYKGMFNWQTELKYFKECSK